LFQIEFVAPRRENQQPEVLDRMMSDSTSVPRLLAHAKSLFANVVHQRTRKPVPHGFRILDAHGTEVAHWSIDEPGNGRDWTEPPLH
jgi:hypothetical protein